MARFITIEDDEGGPKTRLTVVANVIRRITIGTDDRDGLPDDIIASLLPFIGLPGARPRTNGRPNERPRRVEAPPSTTTPESTLDEDEAPRKPAPVPVVDFIAEPDGGQQQETPEPVPDPTPAAPAESAPAPGVRTRGKYRRAPSDEELEKAIREIGTASPSRLAVHFGVPAGTVSYWLAGWRKRVKEAEGSIRNEHKAEHRTRSR